MLESNAPLARLTITCGVSTNTTCHFATSHDSAKSTKKERYITFLDFFVLDGIETLRFGIHCDYMKLMVANLRVFMFVFVLNKPNSFCQITLAST